MLRISRLADYSLVVMSLLAKDHQQYFSATTLASRSLLPVPTVRKILRILNGPGLVASKKGVLGGYQLARSASYISLLDIVEAVDGALALTDCTLNGELCVYSQSCQLQRSWQIINHILAKVLSQLTLSDMMALGKMETESMFSKLNCLLKLPLEGVNCYE